MWYKLNLPKITVPKKWHTESIELISKKAPGYKSYYVTEEFDRQIRSLFPEDFFPTDSKVIAQYLDTRLNNYIHKDGRMYAINYLIQSGGNNAQTRLYDDNRVELDRYKQTPGDWVLLDTFTNHSVNNIENTRISLSISFYEFGKNQWDWLDDNINMRAGAVPEVTKIPVDKL